jgi:hypothetical protein
LVRLGRKEERLVGLEREDRESEACHHHDEHARRKVRDEQAVEAGPERAAHELQRLKALDGRVLPRAEERRDPAADRRDPEDRPGRTGHRRTRHAVVHGEECAAHGGGDDRANQQAVALALHHVAEDGELHRNEVLALVLVAEKGLPQLDGAAFEHVHDAEERDDAAGRVERGPRDDERDERHDQTDERTAQVPGPEEALVNRILVHAPGGGVEAGKHAQSGSGGISSRGHVSLCIEE